MNEPVRHDDHQLMRRLPEAVAHSLNNRNAGDPGSEEREVAVNEAMAARRMIKAARNLVNVYDNVGRRGHQGLMSAIAGTVTATVAGNEALSSPSLTGKAIVAGVLAALGATAATWGAAVNVAAFSAHTQGRQRDAIAEMVDAVESWSSLRGLDVIDDLHINEAKAFHVTTELIDFAVATGPKMFRKAQLIPGVETGAAL